MINRGREGNRGDRGNEGTVLKGEEKKEKILIIINNNNNNNNNNKLLLFRQALYLSSNIISFQILKCFYQLFPCSCTSL